MAIPFWVLKSIIQAPFNGFSKYQYFVQHFANLTDPNLVQSLPPKELAFEWEPPLPCLRTQSEGHLLTFAPLRSLGPQICQLCIWVVHRNFGGSSSWHILISNPDPPVPQVRLPHLPLCFWACQYLRFWRPIAEWKLMQDAKTRGSEHSKVINSFVFEHTLKALKLQHLQVYNKAISLSNKFISMMYMIYQHNVKSKQPARAWSGALPPLDLHIQSAEHLPSSAPAMTMSLWSTPTCLPPVPPNQPNQPNQGTFSIIGTFTCFCTGTSTIWSSYWICGTFTVFCTFWMVGTWTCFTTGILGNPQRLGRSSWNPPTENQLPRLSICSSTYSTWGTSTSWQTTLQLQMYTVKIYRDIFILPLRKDL